MRVEKRHNGHRVIYHVTGYETGMSKNSTPGRQIPPQFSFPGIMTNALCFFVCFSACWTQ